MKTFSKLDVLEKQEPTLSKGHVYLKTDVDDRIFIFQTKDHAVSHEYLSFRGEKKTKGGNKNIPAHITPIMRDISKMTLCLFVCFTAVEWDACM